MPDRHKRQPITFRPPDEDRAWLEARARQSGLPVRRVLALALAAYRAACGDSTPAASPAVESPPVETPPRRKRAAARTVSPAPAGEQAEGSGCGHAYPHVKIIAGVRVCSKCG
jgi:hypothetical protein